MLNRSTLPVGEFDREIGLNYLRGMYLSNFKTIPSRFSKKDLKTLDCKIYHHSQKFKIDDFLVVLAEVFWEFPPFNTYSKTRTQNIPLLLVSPGFDQLEFIHSKEIRVLQALTSTPRRELIRRRSAIPCS